MTQFYIARVVPMGEGVDMAIVGTHTGTEQETRDHILMSPNYPPAAYLLLEKNVTVVNKARA